jgi:Ser/Thr protein kinase RdoA (MazF antagonist)
MRLGAKLGEGGSSVVHEWGDGLVVKLFRPQYAFAIEREVASARAVHLAGIASPRVYDMVEVDGRTGIVFERIAGPSLLEQLVNGARTATEVGHALARIHLAMHAIDVPSLPDLAAVVRDHGLDFPAGSAVFHGDFHPGNVLVAEDGARTIDWVNAHRAPVTADVARTVMAVRYQALRGDQPSTSLERERTARATILANTCARMRRRPRCRSTSSQAG